MPDKGSHLLGPPMSVFDIAPTILHIDGIPVPKQMKGRVLMEIFQGTEESTNLVSVR